MAADDPHGVILGRSRVAYQDGSEDEVLAVVESVGDRSVDSPEWSQHIHDWPTRYHFSALRTNLLRPLAIAAGTRILEIGCGTGPLTRYLGEEGAEVLAVDGSLARARAARARCADLPNVRVLCGTIDDVEETDFDVVLVVGVLEYAGAPPQSERPEHWLSSCVSHLGPDGALVLAIENQLGLKYLIGYDEDHHAVPWIGLADYAGVEGARTWSRRELARIIASVGLSRHRVLLPFPDYKLPRVIVDEQAYGRDDGPRLVDALVRRPVSDDAGQPHLVVDARAGHRLLMEAGLGLDVANSLLFVAAREQATVDALVDGTSVAWLSTAARAPRWRRHRRVAEGGAGLVLVESATAGPNEIDWLRQVREPERDFVLGDPLDVQLAAAFSRGDMPAAVAVLETWAAALDEIDPSDALPHPFAPGPGERALSPQHLDIKPANFIATPDGAVYIDSEWQAVGPISRDLAMYRALWWTSHDLMAELVPLPFPPRASQTEIVFEMCRLAGFEATGELHGRFIEAETAFQAMVNDEPQAVPRQVLETMATSTVADIEPSGPSFASYETMVKALRAQLDALHATVEALRAEMATRQVHTDREIAELREALTNTELEVDALRSTKLFRYAAVPRRFYASLRGRH